MTGLRPRRKGETFLQECSGTYKLGTPLSLLCGMVLKAREYVLQ